MPAVCQPAASPELLVGEASRAGAGVFSGAAKGWLGADVVDLAWDGAWDVAAAGMDPLEHYHNYGFSEGRDPSAHFDTKAYLAANPDVKAAGMDPMLHYLQYGAVEGRHAFDDGHFG